MSVRVVDRVDGWEQRPFSGGFDALHDLADEEYSGVVRAGGAELYVTVGTAVAVRRGTIEDFDESSGTIFEAPHPALPLLAVMQEAEPDVRAQYYTEETPISEVDRTLTDGGFTGFLELSENVLSGDYFLVYHGGNSMSVGFVGASEKLITDDEAFQTADDEVGIYKVRQADVEPLEIPEPAGASESTEATAAAAAEGATEAGEPDDGEAETTDEEPAGGADGASAAGDGTSVAPGGEESEATDEVAASTDEATVPEAEADVTSADATAETEPADDDTAATADAGEATQTGTATPATESSETAATESSGTTQSASESGRDAVGEASAAGGASRTGTDQSARSAPGRERQTDSGPTRQGGASERGAGRSTASQQTDVRRSGGRTPSQSAGDLETRSIPSLDPDQTHVPQRPSRAEPAREAQASTRQTQEPRDGQPAGGDGASAEAAPGATQGGDPVPREPARTEAAGSAGADAGAGSAALSELEDQLAEREAEIDRLESELADATSEREDVEAELESVREERDELETQVERLDEELERLEREFGAATDADQRMSPTEAIEGTNLFVEYDSKGNPTLEDAHGGSDSREEVAENLRLGVHTEFDDRAVAVAGQDFGQFLQGTLHYRFAQWIIGDLLFEIRDTGHADALPDLYDAIPEIRRVEFNGVVDVEYVEDGQEKGGRERFDVIFRHRMGDPLLVANLNDARDPATGGMMTELVTAAERVGQTEEGLSSAFLVTSSFFESEALETVSEATQGGLLSRDSRRSFVNLSRKSGYHLCLVAARDGNFHMEVPEL